MNAFSVATSAGIVVKRRGSASRPARRAGRGASLPIASRMVSLNFAASAVSSTTIGVAGLGVLARRP